LVYFPFFNFAVIGAKQSYHIIYNHSEQTQN